MMKSFNLEHLCKNLHADRPWTTAMDL